MANIEILLTSEAFVKSVLAISDNLAGKYLRPSIREAQDVALRNIIGDALLAKLKALVESGDISQPENAAYKAVLERSQYYLLFQSIAALLPGLTFKVANAGVVKTPDEKVEVVNQAQVELEQARYQCQADAECARLQNYLLEHRDDLPELTDNVDEGEGETPADETEVPSEDEKPADETEAPAEEPEKPADEQPAEEQPKTKKAKAAKAE